MAGLEPSLKAGADIIVNTDADNQYCADDIPYLNQARSGEVLNICTSYTCNMLYFLLFPEPTVNCYKIDFQTQK